MAWTTPMTAVSGNVFTAAQFNTHVRDNLLETCPATVTTAGDMVYADGANSMGSRLAIGASGTIMVSSGSAPVWRAVARDKSYSDGTVSGTLTATSYTTTFTTSMGSASGPTVTVTTGTTALVFIGCEFASNSSAGEEVAISFDISGATTTAPATNNSALHESGSANDRSSISYVEEVALTAGSNTFAFAAEVTAGTGTIRRPRILVIPTS